MKNLLISFFCCFCCLIAPAWGQVDNGIIAGTVRDASGAGVPNVTVAITETETNSHFEVTTDKQGDYVSPPLKVGTYLVTVEAPGFKTYKQSGIVLNVQDRLRVDPQMEVGRPTDQITVTSEVAQVQADTSSLGQVITSEQAEALPLNGRNYIDLANLTAGVVNTNIEHSTNGNTAGAFSANGTRGDLNNYMLDGIDNNNNSGGSAQLAVNVDAIAEFKIQTSDYDAEFGRSGGAALNVVIKSGTNQFHGSVFEFFQNSFMNAQNFFATNTLSSKYNQPGATFGGPVIKNKLFFFGDYQLTDSRTPKVDFSSVPTAAEIAGNFSAPGEPNIYNPNTYNAATGARLPFPGNIIPASDISPLGQAFAALYPAANLPGTRNNYITEPTSAARTDQGDGRVDYRISDADQVFGRYTMSGSTGFGAPKIPGLACGCGYSSQYNFDHGKGASVGETHIFTPNTLNEFRIGFNWNHSYQGVPPGGFKAPPANLAIPGIQNDPSMEGLASINPDGYSSLGPATFTPTGDSSQEREIRDTLNLVRGRHTIRVGGEVRWSEENLFQINAPRGYMEFTGQYTQNPLTGDGGSSIADLLLGIPLTSQIDSLVYFGNRQHVPSLFVQDDFKATSKLTLNLGLRYEYYSPPVDVHNHLANFDYATGQLLLAGQNGNSDALTTAQKLNFAPRVGLAYSPFANTVIRSAYGIFYSGQEVRTGDPLQLAYNLPYYYQPTFVGDGITPQLTLASGFPSLNPSQAINPGVTSVDTHSKTPYYQEWNFTVQTLLPSHTTVEVAYAGSKGVHLQSLTDQNQDLVPGPGDVQSRRPYPFYSGFASIQMRGNSNYNSLQIKIEKHLSHGLTFLSAFTFSHAEDDTVPICCNSPWPDNSYDLHSLKGLADYQQKFRWVTSFDYQLPVGKGQAFLNQNRALDLLLGGWHATGILTATSGFPFTPTQEVDSSNTGTQGIILPNRIANGNLSSGQRSLYQWFDVGAFQDAPNYTFGDSGYNVLIGPGIWNLDLGIRKVFSVTERQKVELRGEFYNALNHPNFGQPNNDIDAGPGAAGAITSLTTNMRTIQVALKYRF
jgi:Carboxypeptidase regulatory-like domain/TonB-dependent Receptor Plug Domain